MINPGLNSVITSTLHSTYRQKETSSNTSSYIYLNNNTYGRSWKKYNKRKIKKEYNKRNIKEAEQEAEILFYIILIGFIGVITCFILSIIYHI